MIVGGSRPKAAPFEHRTALDRHAKLNATRPGLRPELRVGREEREDYDYNRTR